MVQKKEKEKIEEMGREAGETQAQTHTGRVIYCNEDLWRQI